MPDDLKLPADLKLSEVDVRRIMERAVQIDGARSAVTISDLAQAAGEAGISEHAVLQAVRELLQDREAASPVNPGTTTSREANVKSGRWLRAAAFGFLLVIVFTVILFSVRIGP